MKFVTLIALGTFLFLSSEGRAQNDEFFSEREGSSSLVLPLNSDDSADAPSLGTQNASFGSPLDALIQRGRGGGFSPQGDHFGDLLKTTPRNPLGEGRLKLTRGRTFYIPTHDDDDN